MQSIKTVTNSSLLLVLLIGALVQPASAQKLKPEELIAKHLDSIAAADKRKAVTSRSTSGAAQVAFRVGGSGTLNGKGNIISQGNMLRAGFAFPALEYSGEQLVFDGNKVNAGQISPGNYPPLSRFVYENDVLLKEGLLFGSLSTGWALQDVASRKPKLDSTGLKKIDGKQLHELKYLSRNTKNNLQAWFYFDPETYRHVRSVFRLEVPASSSSRITDSAELIRYQIIERFDQFKEVDGFTLPHSYNVEYTIDSPRGGFLATWSHSIDRIVHDESIDRQLFTLQ
jgi:hypothetical protein